MGVDQKRSNCSEGISKAFKKKITQDTYTAIGSKKLYHARQNAAKKKAPKFGPVKK